MQLKYVFATLIILSAAIITGCASNQCIQSQLIEEYYLKPAVGSDAARINTLEQEIIAANNRKTELVKKDHIIDLRTKVAEEDILLQQDKTPYLKANLDLAVGKNDDALVKKAEAELKANQEEVDNKQCVIDYLKARKEVNTDEIAMTDADLAAKIAEHDYIRAKVARANQDKQLDSLKVDNETERINVEEFEDVMKARQKDAEDAQKTYAQSAASLKATPSCGFDEKDLETPPQQIRQQQQEQQQQQQQQQQPQEGQQQPQEQQLQEQQQQQQPQQQTSR